MQHSITQFLKSHQLEYKTFFYATEINTVLGTMLAISDEKKLYFLDFIVSPSIETKIAILLKQNCAHIRFNAVEPLVSIEKELQAYFSGCLHSFQTPIQFFGSSFQMKVWNELRAIPYGQTISYAQLAINISNPFAYRAAANANGRNKLLIVVPCHRVIEGSGKLGGFSSGLDIKAYLLRHEQTFNLVA